MVPGRGHLRVEAQRFAQQRDRFGRLAFARQRDTAIQQLPWVVRAAYRHGWDARVFATIQPVFRIAVHAMQLPSGIPSMHRNTGGKPEHLADPRERYRHDCDIRCQGFEWKALDAFQQVHTQPHNPVTRHVNPDQTL